MFTGKHLCWTLFLIKLQAFSGSNTGVFLWIFQFFKKDLFHRTPPVAAFISTRKGKIGKRGLKENFFKWKKKIKTFYFKNFYLQVLVLVKSEMQIRLWKYYWTAHAFFLRFLQIYFLVIPACSFFVFSFLTNWKIAIFTLILHKYFVYINKKCTCSLAWILWIT